MSLYSQLPMYAWITVMRPRPLGIVAWVEVVEEDQINTLASSPQAFIWHYAMEPGTFPRRAVWTTYENFL